MGVQPMLPIVRRVAVIMLSVVALDSPAAAQNYPDRVVRIVNPYPPGGSVDVMARILAQKLTDSLGQQFIVENRAGARRQYRRRLRRQVGARRLHPAVHRAGAAHGQPDALQQGLAVRPGQGLRPDRAVRDGADRADGASRRAGEQRAGADRAGARSEPGKINFASAGTGTTNHLSGELFKSMAKIDIVHVPYRGAGPAMNDLIGGHVQMFFDLPPVVLPQINAGKVRALGQCRRQRPSALPDLPTIAEQGLPGFDASSWFGFVAPAKTPAPVLARLRDEVAKALKAPDMIARIHELGLEPGTAFGKDFRAPSWPPRPKNGRR